MALQPQRQPSLYLLLSEPQIIHALLAFLALDSVVSSSDGDDIIVKTMDNLQDLLSKAHKKSETKVN
jgi:hypothetical protein